MIPPKDLKKQEQPPVSVIITNDFAKLGKMYDICASSKRIIFVQHLQTMSILRFIKNWMLPISMITGILSYLIYHTTPALWPAGDILHNIVTESQPMMVSLMLFLQFIKVSPTDLRFHRWHLWLLLTQGLVFIALALISNSLPDGSARILTECAMLCFICPTAAAAGVITDKLGGNMAETITYVILVNALAAVLIPCMIPIINPIEGFNFFECFVRILVKVFSILLLPCAIAWTIRYLLPGLQKRLEKYTSWAFYIWGFTLTLALILATRALVLSKISIWTALSIALVSFVCCILQFILGRRIARSYGRAISLTAGQALGQKNTGFLIWLGYSFLTPVTSVAGGFYAIWHNIVNSEELYLHRKEQERNTKPTSID